MNNELCFSQFNKKSTQKLANWKILVCVADFGVTTGHQLPEFPCAFVFNSSETRNGTFASPNFPGFYPRDTECHYFFHGTRTEKVRLQFSYFDVEGVLP
jgi:hypothetical protein